jgi:hypothetical protein
MHINSKYEYDDEINLDERIRKKPKIRYFPKKTDEDYFIFKKMCKERSDEIIFLNNNLDTQECISHLFFNIIENKNNDNNKKVLCIKFPGNEKGKIIDIWNDFKRGYGFSISCYTGTTNATWFPTEIWIYYEKNKGFCI